MATSNSNEVPATDYSLPSRPPTWYELQAEVGAWAAAHPRVCRVSFVGRSRGGESLPLLTIPGGPCRVLVAGGPHPNEPIGFATIVALARHALGHAAARADITWHLLPCSDPDGARRNETWWSAWPPTLESYHRHFYRPAQADQPEWTFPTDQFTAQLPETRALMDVIDSVRPMLFVSLHNSDTGGAFYMASRADQRLGGILRTTADRHTLPIEIMPSDCIGWASPAPGVFVLPDPAQRPSAPDGRRPHGASSAHYANRHGLAIFPEVPLWTTAPYRLPADAIAHRLERAAALVDGVLANIQPHTDGTSVFRPAVQDTVSIMNLVARTVRERPDQGDDQDLALTMPLRAFGMLLRHIDGCVVAGPAHPVLLRERARVEQEFIQGSRAAQEALRPEPIPLSRTAGFQIDTILATAQTLMA